MGQQCKDKIPFDSMADANKCVRATNDKSDRVLRAYRCRECNLWHLTSQSKSKERRISKKRRRREKLWT